MNNKYAKHKEITEQLYELYYHKNTTYNDSFGKTLQAYGPVSALTRMRDKWQRIEALVLSKQNSAGDESLADTLRDMANYCIMTLIEFDIIKENKDHG